MRPNGAESRHIGLLIWIELIRQCIDEVLPMRFTTGVLGAILLISDAQAQAASVQRGLQFAQTKCARCHSINKSNASPLSRAPPFRDLLNRYSVEGVKELLTDAFLVDHPSMPKFELNPDQIDDFIAFLATLEQ